MTSMNESGGTGQQGFDSGFLTGEIRHAQVSARVPDDIAPGVFSTGVIVLSNQTEFVLDFLLRMSRPYQVAVRVVLPPIVVPQVIAALSDNIGKYVQRFGPIPPLPKPEMERRPSIQEIYDELKLPDRVLSGAYANGVMIGHSAAEFSLDFITNFFPRSAVSARVFMSAPHAPRLLESLTQTFNDFQRRVAAARQAQQDPLDQPNKNAAPDQSPPPTEPDASAEPDPPPQPGA